MQRMIAALVLIFGSYCGFAEAQNQSACALPNPALLTCRAAGCSQLLPEQPQPGAIYPRQIMVDMNEGCIYGLTATYDKSVPPALIKSAVDQRYKQWALDSQPPLSLWRVEPQKFAIQLSVATKQDEKKHLAEAGTTQLIYLAIGGRSACNQP